MNDKIALRGQTELENTLITETVLVIGTLC
jgi:hypothetical protein